ncbi:uncharacterized protein UV8b_01312 [Ustilaginoidea virens]|uniref:Uncharacterized protein n=1 Tax=Ustilaginoidea virens TaxID=1159556 RepID=A0A8E5ME82_USTVR|nr:uncharacterized protein UV8b_01312 [Ustilaginoidea virens]QUC17071.1 hypothetical protein UV8b_01312 [Ustilaginoidea virens]
MGRKSSPEPRVNHGWIPRPVSCPSCRSHLLLASSMHKQDVGSTNLPAKPTVDATADGGGSRFSETSPGGGPAARCLPVPAQLTLRRDASRPAVPRYKQHGLPGQTSKLWAILNPTQTWAPCAQQRPLGVTNTRHDRYGAGAGTWSVDDRAHGAS